LSKTFKSEGIVFRSLKYSETSLILDIYTREIGLQSFIVSGVRKSKSKFANVFQAMNIIDLIAYKSENSLSRIKESELAIKYDKINSNIVFSSLGIFIIDLTRSVIKEREADEQLYSFLKSYLLSLDKKDKADALLPINFSIELASILGFALTNNYSEEHRFFDLQSGQFISNLILNTSVLPENISYNLFKILSEQGVQTIDKTERNIILDKLLRYFEFHIEGFKPLKSLPVLRTILS